MHRLSLVAAAVLLATSTRQVAALQNADSVPPTVSVATDDLARSGEKHLRSQGTVLLPDLLVLVSAEGVLRDSRRSANNTAQVSVSFEVSGAERALLRNVALRLRDSLATLLRANGFTVITSVNADQNNSRVSSATAPMDSTAVPMRKHVQAGRTYAVGSALGTHTLTSAREAVNAYAPMAKLHNAVVIIPEVWFNTPQMIRDSRLAMAALKAQVRISSGMDLFSAGAYFVNGAGGKGAFELRAQVPNISYGVGYLNRSQMDSAQLALPGKVGMSGTTGNGMVNARSGLTRHSWADYRLELEAAEFSAAVVRGGSAFLNALALAFKEERERK